MWVLGCTLQPRGQTIPHAGRGGSLAGRLEVWTLPRCLSRLFCCPQQASPLEAATSLSTSPQSQPT